MRGPKFYVALWVSKALSRLIDLVAKGRGTNLPGVVALKIDPNFLSHFRGIDPEKTIFITGTNGKSTSTNLLSRVLTEQGYRVISNLDGANMTPGVAVPLLKASSLLGRVACDYVVMETDERYVARIRKQLPARYLGITNIQKDQVQRNGEPSFIYHKIKDAIHPDMTLFLNGDEPNTLSLASAGAKTAVTYGVAQHEHSFHKEDDFFAVSMPCPKCHSGLQFDEYNLDNVGVFHCPVCGYSSSKKPDYQITDVSFQDEWFSLEGCTYPFHCNSSEYLYSYALATAIALELGIDRPTIAKALDRFQGLASRRADHPLGRHNLKFFKMKQENAEALQSIINTIAKDKRDKVLLFSCEEYYWAFPPYLNVCFMFDCDFRYLLKSGIHKWICISTGAAHISALRFLYDGFDPETLGFLPESTEAQLTNALRDISCDNIYLMEEFPFWGK